MSANLNSQSYTSEESEIPQCVLCGSQETGLRADRLRYGEIRDVRECRQCGLVFLWPIEHPKAKIADFYKQGFRDLPRQVFGLDTHDPHRIYNARLGQANRRFQLVKPYIKKGMSLLEVGCSAGSFLSVAKPHFDQCTGIELDRIFASYVRDNLDVPVWETPVEDIGPIHGRFDIICMWHVLEHLRDPESTLKHISSLLSESGILFVEVPNILDPLLTIWHSKAFSKFYYQAPHIYYFSPTTLRKVFERAGWNVDIMPLQIYGLGNNLRWALFGVPQANQPSERTGAFNILDRLYRRRLVKTGNTDTLFAIGRRR